MDNLINRYVIDGRRFFQTSLQENFVNLIKIVIFYKFKFIYFRIYLIITLVKFDLPIKPQSDFKT